MSDPHTSEHGSVFVCECEEWMRSACMGGPFGEHEGKRYCVLHYPAREKSAIFKELLKAKLDQKNFNFRGVWFPDALSFFEFNFEAAVDFRRATFNADSDFGKATFKAGANFKNATFSGKASFRKAAFTSGPKTDFSFTTFDAPTDFSFVNFGPEVYFSFATFKTQADFRRATFEAEADFRTATFGSWAYFRRATFKHADFGKAIFSGKASIRATTFDQGAYFRRATFSLKADFRRAAFKATADLARTTFSAKADFTDSTFSADASFKSAVFRGLANFTEATFNEELDFAGATFVADVYFRDALLRSYVKFNGHEDTPMFSNSSSLDLQFAKIEQPNHVLFQNLILRPYWFVNANTRELDFLNVTWRIAFDDELVNLKTRNITSPHVRLSKTFRDLAINCEENHRYEQASRFRYWAMDTLLRERWRGFPFWRLSWWYWLASGYGERALQAFMVLVGIWFLSALLYNQVGFGRWEPKVASEADVISAQRDETGTPLRLGRALTYSAGVMTFQKPEPRPATLAAQTIVVLETILGPVQAALLALAIRRKFMR